MASIITKIPNICFNIGRIVCHTKQAYVVNIATQKNSQYLYPFGYTAWDTTTYETIVKNPICIHDNLVDNPQKTNLSRVYHPTELIYPMLDLHNNSKYIINNGDRIYYGFLYLGFTQKLVIIPKKI